MTSKEKNLIVVVLGVIVIIAYFFLMLRPITADIESKKTELTTLNAQMSTLKLEYVNKEKYLDEIQTMTEYIEAVNARFPAFVNQEKMIKTVIDLEQEIESLQVPIFNMTIPQAIISAGEYKDEETGEVKYKESLYKTQVTLDLNMTYADMKKMLAYIRSNEEKLSVNGMNMTSDLINDSVVTSFSLDFYFLVSDDRPFVPEDFFGPFEPKEDSIFSPFEEFGTDFNPGVTDDEVIVEEDDFILNLSTIYADRSTVIMYKNRDLTGDTYVYADNRNPEPLEIVFEQVGDLYYFKYRTSVEQYPGNYQAGAVFEPGNYIDLAVYSSSKVDSEDNSGVDATIVNNTDLPLNIRIITDDLTNPRFNVVSETGNIIYVE